MYLIVEMRDGEIVWSDSKLCKSKESANVRRDMIKKQTRKEYRIIVMTKYKLLVS